MLIVRLADSCYWCSLCNCNNADTPVLVGDSASDTSNECVECTSTDFGSCGPNDSCELINNVCVGTWNQIYE